MRALSALLRGQFQQHAGDAGRSGLNRGAERAHQRRGKALEDLILEADDRLIAAGIALAAGAAEQLAVDA